MSENQIQSKLAEIEQVLNKRWPENKIEPTLDRISALVDALGSPQLSYPTINCWQTLVIELADIPIPIWSHLLNE